jgi:Tfp pilus assembly protein PilX
LIYKLQFLQELMFNKNFLNFLPRVESNGQKGATAILITFFVLMIILLVSLTSASVIVSEVRMSREIANSVPAFYAADAGAERCLYQTRCGLIGSPTADCIAEIGAGLDGGCASSVYPGSIPSYNLVGNGATVFPVTRTSATQITSNGTFSGTNRKVEINWTETSPSSGPAPMAYWNFDETSGTTAFDSSGNHYDGTASEGGDWTTPGKVGTGALDFDQYDDYVNIGQHDLMTGTFTLSAWFNYTGTSGAEQDIVAQQKDTVSTDQLAIPANTNIVRYSLTNQNNTPFNLDAPVTPGQWYLATVVIDGTTASLYLNGSLVTTTNIVTPVRVATVGNADLIIGSTYLPGGKWFGGLIDDVRIYDYALSGPDIQALYDAVD